jgi:hypothetical protein
LSDLHKLTHHLPAKNLMTFSKSNLNVLPESLFTELTADQAQMLEGGERIDILTVRCIQAGNGSDNLSFNIDRRNVMFGRTLSMRAGSVANAGVSANVSGIPRVSLFDGGISLGGFNASGNGQQTRRVSGGGSTYDVTYRVGN